MADTSLIKSGDILYQTKSILKVSWVKKFCVLHRKTEDEHPYMELFDDKQSFTDYKEKQKKCDIRKIELQHLKSIKTASERKKDGTEYMLELKIGKKTNNLMFTKECDFQDWLTKFESLIVGGTGSNSRENSASYGDDDSCGDNDEVVTLNQMYARTDSVERFSVSVENSPLTMLCGITGQMTLLVGQGDIGFEDPKTKSLKYSFQLSWMRRFGKVGSTIFTFEVGRKCPNGEGEVKCETNSAKEIHNLVAKKSHSNSQTVIPRSPTRKAPDKVFQPIRTSTKEEEEPPLPKKPDDLGQVKLCSGPFPVTKGTRHPGVSNLPKLNAIVRQNSKEDETHNKTKSLHAHRSKEMDKASNNGHVRPASYRSAVTNPDFTKELEKKIHTTPDDTLLDTELNKKDSVKTKEEKKREKEERKEREKREKEEKKEEERRLKEQEKERKQKEKEAKKSGKKDKHKDIDKPEVANKKGGFVIGGSGLYEDTDIVTPTTPTKPTFNDDSLIYDEATSPTSPASPVEYAKPVKNKSNSAAGNDECLYDEAVSVNTNNKQTPSKSEYAEPYSKKGGVPVRDLYTDVQHVKGEAWKVSGRETDEEIFEENYAGIKIARQQMNKTAPPIIPAKNFDDEDVDDTYDTIQSSKPKTSKRPPSKTENLYGIASATEVGKLPDVVEPEADYNTDSDDGEEVTYDDPTYDYEDYQTPAELMENTSNQDNDVATYEEAVISNWVFQETQT